MTPPHALVETRRPILYGRRKGRKLRAAQITLFETALARVGIEQPREGDAINPSRMFPFLPPSIWLEIGFGGGEHLAAQARTHPETGFIGCEPYRDGVIKLLRLVEDQSLENVRIFHDDARLLIAALEPDSIARAFLLFPDPWPKARHHRRRFVIPENLNALARILKGGAELRFATDDEEYRDWAIDLFTRHSAFSRGVSYEGEIRQADDWPRTRYEEKAISRGRPCAHMTFVRRGRGTP